MTRFLTRGAPTFALVAAIAVLTSGCSSSSSPGTANVPDKDKSVAKNDIKPGGDKKEVASAEPKGDHSGWWCDEHGLPESVCDLCSKKYRSAEKAKGNWCEHDRVKTSCFKCNPGLKEKYAAEYKAKFGKGPARDRGR